MDPQQRMLLETAHEALQGLPVSETAASRQTSVLIGIGTVEYTTLAAHLGTGIYVATGRCTSTMLRCMHPVGMSQHQGRLCLQRSRASCDKKAASRALLAYYLDW